MLLSRLESSKDRYYDYKNLILSNIFIYYINNSEIPSELSRENFISSHVKRSPSLRLHNKSRLWKQADLVFHWYLHNKQNITYSLMDMIFIFSCSTPYRVDHSKIKFISTRGRVISSIEEPMYLRREISCFALVWAALALRDKFSIFFFKSPSHWYQFQSRIFRT